VPTAAEQRVLRARSVGIVLRSVAIAAVIAGLLALV
jgi:hypothetical protein